MMKISFQTIPTTGKSWRTTLYCIQTIIRAAVNILSHRNECPSIKDREAAKRTIRYLKTTINLTLIYTNFEKPVLRAYSDSDWADVPNKQKVNIGEHVYVKKQHSPADIQKAILHCHVLSRIQVCGYLLCSTRDPLAA